MRYLLPAFLLCCTSLAIAQKDQSEVQSPEVIEGLTYLQQTIPERSTVPYPVVREADVMYCKKVERMMDTREKQNLLCQYPGNPLYQVIFDAVERGEIAAYKSDSFTDTWRSDTVLDMFAIVESGLVPSRIYPGEFEDTLYRSQYPLETIFKWRIIEEWIIDKQTGELLPRIVGIAPMMNLTVQGQDLGEYEGFYIKWSEARRLLVNERAFNRYNDAPAFTYYDFFEQQLYSADLTKESNVFDLDFSQYPELMDNPLAQILAAQKAKEKIMNFESDLWQY